MLKDELKRMPFELRTPFLKLKCEIATQRFLRAGRRLVALLRKAGFNPDQPRVPAGQSEGGQ